MPLSPRIVALSVSSKRSFLPQRQISVTLQSSPEKAYSAVVWKGIGLCRQRRRQVRDRAGEESELGKVMTACWWRRCRTLLYSWSILNNDGLPAVIRTAVELGGGILNIRVPLGMESSPPPWLASGLGAESGEGRRALSYTIPHQVPINQILLAF
jgi:hypothetical protein